jgi:broad specificity phosphatase PhoE
MTLIAIRHGATKLNDADRVRATLNPPIDPEGRKQMEATAQHFKGMPVTEINTSNMMRSIQSGQILQKAMPNAKIKPSAALRPWDMGHFAGQKVAKVRKQIDHFYKNPDQPPPGSKESYNQFLGRFLPAVMPMIHDSQPHVLVSHNRNMHALEALAAGKGQHVDAKVLLAHPEGNTKPGGVMVLDHTYQPKFYNPPGGREQQSSQGLKSPPTSSQNKSSGAGAS